MTKQIERGWWALYGERYKISLPVCWHIDVQRSHSANGSLSEFMQKYTATWAGPHSVMSRVTVARALKRNVFHLTPLQSSYSLSSKKGLEESPPLHSLPFHCNMSPFSSFPYGLMSLIWYLQSNGTKSLIQRSNLFPNRICKAGSQAKKFGIREEILTRPFFLRISHISAR